MSSFDISVGGLMAQAAAIQVTSNNVANASTVGYKARESLFVDQYFKAVQSGGVAGAADFGAKRVDTQGALKASTSVLDLAVQGQGMFRLSSAISGDGANNYYTRNGSFSVDKAGYIVNANGLYLTGYQPNDTLTGTTPTIAALKMAPADVAPLASTTGQLVANLDTRGAEPLLVVGGVTTTTPKTFLASDASTFNSSTTVQVYDSKGLAHQVSLFFKKVDTTVVDDPRSLTTPKAVATAVQYEVYMQADGVTMTTTPAGNHGMATLGNAADTAAAQANALANAYAAAAANADDKASNYKASVSATRAADSVKTAALAKLAAVAPSFALSSASPTAAAAVTAASALVTANTDLASATAKLGNLQDAKSAADAAVAADSSLSTGHAKLVAAAAAAANAVTDFTAPVTPSNPAGGALSVATANQAAKQTAFDAALLKVGDPKFNPALASVNAQLAGLQEAVKNAANPAAAAAAAADLAAFTAPATPALAAVASTPAIATGTLDAKMTAQAAAQTAFDGAVTKGLADAKTEVARFAGQLYTLQTASDDAAAKAAASPGDVALDTAASDALTALADFTVLPDSAATPPVLGGAYGIAKAAETTAQTAFDLAGSSKSLADAIARFASDPSAANAADRTAKQLAFDQTVANLKLDPTSDTAKTYATLVSKNADLGIETASYAVLAADKASADAAVAAAGPLSPNLATLKAAQTAAETALFKSYQVTTPAKPASPAQPAFAGGPYTVAVAAAAAVATDPASLDGAAPALLAVANYTSSLDNLAQAKTAQATAADAKALADAGAVAAAKLNGEAVAKSRIGTLQFVDGQLVGSLTQVAGTSQPAVPALYNAELADANGIPLFNVELDLSSMTAFGAGFAVTKNSANGYAPGALTGLSIDETGQMSGQYTNGMSLVAGQLVLASFNSEAGLDPASGIVFSETYASGAPVLGTGTGGSFGAVRSMQLEQSTTDMAAELVNLMVQQRNYQANSQGLQAANTLLQTAISMGR